MGIDSFVNPLLFECPSFGVGIFLSRQTLPAQADVAQLVERSIRNRQVSGSIPLVGSIPKDPSRGISDTGFQSGRALADFSRRVFSREFFLDNGNSKLLACDR